MATAFHLCKGGHAAHFSNSIVNATWQVDAQELRTLFEMTNQDYVHRYVECSLPFLEGEDVVVLLLDRSTLRPMKDCSGTSGKTQVWPDLVRPP
jgi:hypothetical protein